ncbi:DUF4276 family protein [Nocardiopsis sp. M1B1]|uniref:DUF4276 family protein n=1 Tax=Nocardiopsis sp. M1B1 TaxID=3450454 RepID=UPI00403A1652
MSPITIAPIVEGHGEHRAVRDLLTRVATEYADTWIDVAQPFRLDSAKMRKPDELTRAVLLQSRRVPDRGGVLVLRDGDDKDITCPVELARSIATDPALVRCPVEVVIACPEYEAWFLAAAESLRGHSAMGDDAVAPDDPEAKRDAKAQLNALMTEPYRETLHQVKFTATMDMRAVEERSRSFRRLVHAVQLLVG